jgi:2-(1,2-epoxy-1,2-dihydrophenyl)acetyl-CoA isomerase
MSIALACDLMIVAQGAYLMSPFVNIGLIPDGGAAWFLIRRVGYTRAFDLLTSGQKLSAEQCLAWGIANRVAAPMALRDEALTWAAQLADSAPLAIAMTKRALRLSQTTGLADMLGVEADLQVACYASEDSREARAAFVEKRKPTFRGQ